MTPPAAPEVLHDLAAIESELARLWRANAGPDDGGEARAVLRAATFNLIAIVPSEEESQKAASVLAALMFDHPGRVLILRVDPEAREAQLEAWVTMHCRPIGGGPQVCGEQVVITATGAAVERLTGGVAALLLPDSPAVAWWRGGPGPAAPLLDRLAPSLDAVLLDGTRFDPGTLPRWAARITSGGTPLPVGDLAWLRGALWRGWTADCFETEGVRPALRALTEVHVTCGADAEMAGLLYVAWLAARLAWHARPGLRRVAGGSWEGRLTSSSGAIAVRLRLVEAPPGFAAITLTSGGLGVRGALVRQSVQGVSLEVARGDEIVQRRLIRQPELDEVALVGRWLERPHWDPIYAEALAILPALAGA